MARQTFAQVFKERMESLEEDAKSVGINLTTICEEANISRATPDRWRRRIPKTIMLVDEMEAVVARLKKDKSKAAR